MEIFLNYDKQTRISASLLINGHCYGLIKSVAINAISIWDRLKTNKPVTIRQFINLINEQIEECVIIA